MFFSIGLNLLLTVSRRRSPRGRKGFFLNAPRCRREQTLNKIE
ncbi:hypothetical protein HMPREF3038_02793 [Akkermansia sp. KLE1797]|nr:hypothetical protein HMPREF3038_02793 [Akkermansia sp. KLE1797]KXU53106.1 hypothetical protein HMPREF3039_02662 [Akkermansia sp. KLE1798]